MEAGRWDGRWELGWSWELSWDGSWELEWKLARWQQSPRQQHRPGDTIPEGHGSAARGTNNSKHEQKVKFDAFGNAKRRGKEQLDEN